MKYRYVIGDCCDPYWNLAYEQSLFSFADQDTAVLFLWQNRHTIVVGRNQDVYSECRADEFMCDKGYIARRRSGGGAVYHDMGNLNFSIICRNEFVRRNRYQELLVRVLKRFSIYAEFNGRNDLLLDGAKFSGNAVFTDGGITCQHGTILIAADIGKMSYFLTPDESKLSRNHVKSVSSRVVNLNEADGRITVDSMRKVMIMESKAEPLPVLPSKNDIERYADFYRNKEWIFGGKI